MILTNVLTIIIPVYNEKKTIQKIIDKVLKIKNLKKQIIIVDDGSTDGTTEVLKKIQKKKFTKLFILKKIRGKDML